MDKAKLDRLQGLIEAGFSSLWDAITLAMDVNEGEPGHRPLGWPALPEVVERLDYANRMLSGLIGQLPRRAHDLRSGYATCPVPVEDNHAGVMDQHTHR
jgi:hypothetical protein